MYSNVVRMKLLGRDNETLLYTRQWFQLNVRLYLDIIWYNTRPYVYILLRMMNRNAISF